ncbi:MAG TPA: TraR/DksA C4-type zinc finger protein [Acidimicrobiales bacterium]|nr:TraR/DksA C4-type zinc finger protein [Acidimicrobiales bacterium]
MPGPELLSQLRAALEAERADVAAQLAEHGDVGFDENFADSGQVAAEQGEHRAMVGHLQDTLRDVEHALAKLADGSYGKCEVCGEEIAEARLEAMPATRYCINHA